MVKERQLAPRKRTAAAEAKSQHFSLKKIKPLTENQERTFEAYEAGNHLVLSGSAGSGKSFLAMYLGLKDLLEDSSHYNRIIIIRSAVPSRDLGFVPGTLEEKAKIYQEPYQNIVNELIGRGDAWHFLMNKEIIEFQTTSFLRGLTFRDCIIIFDEFQSATFHESCTVLTRIGENCRFILCGDYNQNDLVKGKEKTGYSEIVDILSEISNVSIVQFGIQDIVRSGFVKEFLTVKERKKL
jgi:phosphate starvation-inducible protein PhoH and related proteins